MPQDVVDDIEKFINAHAEKLRKMGIRKISHMLERAWYRYKDYLEKEL